MNTPSTAKREDLSSLLEQRDLVIASEPEFSELTPEHAIENAAIRELGQIVSDTAREEKSYFTGT